MAGANITDFEDSTFEDVVLKSDVPVLVDFWAEWCQPCRALGPIIEQLADEFAEKVKIGKLDIDKNSKTAMNYSVSSIPTVLLFNGGEMVERLVGMKPKKDYEQALRALMPSAAS